MGRGIYKQPNGLYAVWSSTVDNFVLIDATPDDIVQDYVESYERDIRDMVTRRVAQLDTPGKLDETWERKVRWVGLVHGPDGLRELAAYTEGWWEPSAELLAWAQRNEDHREDDDYQEDPPGGWGGDSVEPTP